MSYIDNIDDLDSLLCFLESVLEDSAEETDEFKLAVYETALCDAIRAIRRLDSRP